MHWCWHWVNCWGCVCNLYKCVLLVRFSKYVGGNLTALQVCFSLKSGFMILNLYQLWSADNKKPCRSEKIGSLWVDQWLASPCIWSLTHGLLSECDVDFSSRRKNKRHFRSQKCSGLRWSIVLTLPSFQCLIRRVYVRKVGRQTEPLGAAETWALLSHCDYVVLVSCHTLVRPHCLTKIHQQQLICNDSFALLVRFYTATNPERLPDG